MLKMDGMIDRPSDVNRSFKHYSPSLCSLVAAVADFLKKKKADRDIIRLDCCRFLVHVVVLDVILATG